MFIRNPYFLFLILLIIYIVYILQWSNNPSTLIADEARYIGYAHNLLEGKYAFNFKPFLWSGPGYPLILAPLVGLKVPIIAVRIVNAFFYYLSVIFFYRTLCFYMSSKKSFLVAGMLGLYIPAIKLVLPLLFTEIFTLFLICAFIYSLALTFQTLEHKKRNIVITSFLLAYIALTKVIFGYVILTGIIFFTIFYFFTKSNQIKKLVVIYALALVFCLPYLIYTYQLTDKILYWGNAGGMQLYWLASPFKEDMGEWHPFHEKVPYYTKNHAPFIDSISHLNPVDKDIALKKRALNNIINNPKKIARNWAANIGRLLFNHPKSSYTGHNNQILNKCSFFQNGLLAFFSFLFILPTIIFRRNMHFEILAILFFAFSYLGGVSLLSAYARFFVVIVPALLLWIAYMCENFLEINRAKLIR